ncbi:MAG TPA: phosphotransferase [Candidatus Binataceae bacterium]|nr:phosphotransferase [Candidatus Binataceae bacterium]
MTIGTTPDVARVRQGLADYLGAEISRLEILASGWETTVFEFALGSAADKAEMPVGRPMVLRFYQGTSAGEKGPREYMTLRALAKTGYPAPRPYLYESAIEPLGVPFLIMDRSEGGPLLQLTSFPKAFKAFSLAFFAFVRAHVLLHRFDPSALGLDQLPPRFGFARGSSPTPTRLLDRVLTTIAQRVEEGPLPALEPMLEWARAGAERFPCQRNSVLHLDYHPQNAVVSGIRVTGIIDWVNTDIGDRHLDAATTSAILASSTMERPRWMRRNAIGNCLRRSFTTLYLALYHAMAPVDFQRLRYYQGVAALLRLSMFGMMRTRGPESVGFRPEAIVEITPSVTGELSRYAARKSGLAIQLESVMVPSA